jgi:hypothetical protein
MLVALPVYRAGLLLHRMLVADGCNYRVEGIIKAIYKLLEFFDLQDIITWMIAYDCDDGRKSL